MPSATPIAIAMAVSVSVITNPSRIGREKKYCPKTGHSKRASVAIDQIALATKTAIAAATTQRQGWRTGTALIVFAPEFNDQAVRAGQQSISFPPLFDAVVDLRYADRLCGEVPLLEN